MECMQTRDARALMPAKLMMGAPLHSADLRDCRRGGAASCSCRGNGANRGRGSSGSRLAHPCGAAPPPTEGDVGSPPQECVAFSQRAAPGVRCRQTLAPAVVLGLGPVPTTRPLAHGVVGPAARARGGVNDTCCIVAGPWRQGARQRGRAHFTSSIRSASSVDGGNGASDDSCACSTRTMRAAQCR